MAGRYGTDPLNRALNIATLVFLVLSLFIGGSSVGGVTGAFVGTVGDWNVNQGRINSLPFRVLSPAKITNAEVQYLPVVVIGDIY